MPIYDLKCFKCDKLIFDHYHKSNSEFPTCTECNVEMSILPGRVGVVYTGQGFHVNDYRKDSK